MKYSVLLMIMFITACTTVPVAPKFPQVPNELKQKCVQLEKLNDDTKLSDVAKSVTKNYTLYHECSIKLNAWIEWYDIQKQTYESIK